MNTPKTLSDLRYELNKLHLNSVFAMQTESRRWFHEHFQNQEHVYTRKLFTEDDKTVYEAYQDSGSDDYLYIIVG